MISVQELNKYELEQINNVPYDKYKILWYIENYNMQELLNKYYEMNNYDILCKYLLNIGTKIKLSDKFISINDINFILPNVKSLQLPLNIIKYYWFKYIIDKINVYQSIKSNSFLILTNSDKVINQAIFLKTKSDIILFPNTEYKININQLSDIVKNTNIEIYYEKNDKKYDNIMIRNFEFMYQYYLPYFELTKLPSTILLIKNGLLKLNKNGNLFINIRILYINNAFEKIINLLNNSFKNIIITNSNTSLDSNLIIECYGFLDNINKQTNEQLTNLTKTKYNYSLCNFMNYYYHMIQTKTPFMYYINTNNLQKQYKSNYKRMPILDDFDIQNNDLFKSSSKSLYLIQNIKNIYYNFIDNINFMIFQYVDNNNININLLKKLNYERLEIYLDILKKYNIPYDKTILAYIDKYNINQINQLHSLDNNIKFLLTKTNKFLKSNNNWNNFNITKSYYYNELKNIQEMYELAIKTNNLTVKRGNLTNRIPLLVKAITDNYSRGVAKYINQSKKYKLAFEISNGFTKIWEMLSSVHLLSNQKDKDVNVFFIAEAPGQWIYSVDYYIKKKLDNIKKWDWRATSLNPKHPINIERFGKGILDDAYGFIKHYPDKWLWGVDQTGDITKSENIRWYHQYVKEWAKPNLVTGDAGLQSDNPEIYQKLELAQVLMVAAVSAKGGNCIIKHFLPYIPDIPETKDANGFFINYIYLYYLMFEDVYLIKPLSSNPVSGEFYVIGKNFIGLDNTILDKMLNLLDNFEVNMCFFKKEDIPEHFTKQVFDFMEKLTRLNVDFIEIQNTLLTCLYKRDAVIEKVTGCRKYLNPKYMDEVQESKFKKWVQVYNFI
jgi:hypothetical protein